MGDAVRWWASSWRRIRSLRPVAGAQQAIALAAQLGEAFRADIVAVFDRDPAAGELTGEAFAEGVVHALLPDRLGHAGRLGRH